jgi:hypothetical protein
LRQRKEKAAQLDPEILAKKAFSRKELEHCRARTLKSGVLYIDVDSSTWLYYFNLHKKDALTKIAGQNGQVKDLKFRLGQIQVKPAAE